jgi:BolA protein
MINKIKQKLQALEPTYLEVIDESDMHRGHAGHHGNGTSHVRLEIESKAFDGISSVERHRRIHNLLREELAGGLHALSIVIKT